MLNFVVMNRKSEEGSRQASSFEVVLYSHYHISKHKKSLGSKSKNYKPHLLSKVCIIDCLAVLLIVFQGQRMAAVPN